MTRRQAAETAATQLRRLLHLIPTLADGREHPVREVAEKAGVAPKTLIADLTALVERYDVPAAWVNSVDIAIEGDIVSISRADHFLRPMRLTISELCALELGLMLVQQEAEGAVAPEVDSAIARLRQAIAALPSKEWKEQLKLRAAAGVPHADVPELATVRQALRERRKVHMRYRAGGDEHSTERTICPYGIAYAAGNAYVVAYCERSGALRFFRSDRIELAEVLPDRVVSSGNVAAVLEAGRAFQAADADTMTVCYSPRIARWIAEREGQPLAADGSLTLEHPVADEDWAVRHVLQYGPDAEVVEPAATRAAVRARLVAMGATADGGARSGT